MLPKSTRRQFLKSTAVGAGILALPAGAARAYAANERLRLACIGCGGMGHADYQQLRSHPRIEVAALCDVDADRLRHVANQEPQAGAYADWRELFEREADRIDVVSVSTPDHTHAGPVLAALRRGKHVYCQKPMCHDIAEVRAVTQAAKAAGVRTQLGTQGASAAASRLAVRMVQDGAIGKVRRVAIRQHRADAGNYRLEGPRPAEGTPPPESLNWDLWLGTAPKRPYAPQIYHPALWRTWLDFGTGWLGDIGCHQLHFAWRAMEWTAPTDVTAEVEPAWRDSPARRADTWPRSAHVRWTFPANRFTDGPVTLDWYDGDFPVDDELVRIVDHGEMQLSSAFVVGEHGTMCFDGAVRLFPHAKFEGHARPQVEGGHHYIDFVEACLDGCPTESDFAHSGPMTEAVLIGTVAQRVPDTRLEWDTAKLAFTNSAKAQSLVRRRYREGWEIEGI